MKRLTALLLCMVLLFGLAACAAKAETTQTPNASSQETKPAEEPKKEETKQEESKPEEPAAPEIVPGELPLVTEPTTITIGVLQNADTEDYETNDYTKWIEEQTGLNLDFVYFSTDDDESITQLNLMIASGEKLPDILWGFAGITTALTYELGEDGYFIDMKDYFDKYAYYFWEEYQYVSEGDREMIFPYGTDPSNGAFYGFPRYTTGGGDCADVMPVINTDWLDAIGAEAPKNVDELYDVLKKFATEDPNGNGTADEMPMIGYQGGYRTNILEYVINAFVYCLDDDFFNATDGEIWVPFTTDEYRQAMIYLNKLYSEGLISPLFYTITDKSEYKALVTPSDGTAIAGVASIQATLHVEDDNEVMYQYQPLQPLEAATELGGYSPIRGSTYQYYSFITSDCEDPVLAFRLLDFMCGRESYARMRFGIYGEHWEWAEEGAMSSLGKPAAIHVLDTTPYSSQNNILWHSSQSYVGSSSRVGTQANLDPTTFRGRRSILYAGIFNTQNDWPHPEEVVHKLIYDAEEQETVSATLTPIRDYVAEARAMFVSGVMDPNDDAAWNTYLANLEAQGLNDLLDAAQSAYSRMFAE